MVRSIGSEHKPIGINLISGALNTYHDVIPNNPNIVVIELDKELMIPVNVTSYYVDISKANNEGRATWEHQLDFLRDFGMPDLSPASIYQQAKYIQTREYDAQIYFYNKFKKVA